MALLFFLSGCQLNSEAGQSLSLNQSYVTVNHASFDRSQLKDHTFIPYHYERLIFDNGNNHNLIRVSLAEPFRSDVDYVITIDPRQLRVVGYFSEKDNGSFTDHKEQYKYQSDESMVFSNHKFVFDFDKNSRYHYIQIDNYKNASVSVNVFEKNDYIRFDSNVQWWSSILLSVLVGLILIKLIFAVIGKEKFLVNYWVYLLFISLAFYWQLGTFSLCLETSCDFYSEAVWLLFGLSAQVFLNRYIYHFLQLNWRIQPYGQCLMVLLLYWLLLLLLCLLSILLVNESLFTWLFEAFCFGNGLGVFVMLWVTYNYRDYGDKQSDYLFLSLLLLLPCVVVNGYYLLHPQPLMWWQMYITDIAVCLQTIIVVIGFSYRLFGYKKSYDQLQQNVSQNHENHYQESLIVSFRHQLKEQILKEQNVDHFNHHIETHFAQMLMKFVPLNNVVKLTNIEQKIELLNLSGSEISDDFEYFWSVHKGNVNNSCNQGDVFYQAIKNVDHNNKLYFLGLPIITDYNDNAFDLRYVILEFKPLFLLDQAKVDEIKCFIDKSLEVLFKSDDIKKIIQHKQKLLDSIEEAENLMQMKDRFFAHFSHELRTPLALTIAPLKDLKKQREFLNTSGKYLVDTALTNAQELMNQVDEMLDVQKMSEQHYPLAIDKVNLNKLIYRSIGKLKTWSLERDQHVFFEKRQEQDVWLFCDANETSKMIINLLSNAIKYSGNNSDIAVSISMNESWIKIHVKDNGMGIEPELHNKIFDRYFQVQAPSNHGKGGCGLGLSYVKEVMSSHHGKVTVESEYNHGSEFVLWFKQGHDHFDVMDSYLSKNIEGVAQKNQSTLSLPSVTQGDAPLSSVLIVEDNVELRQFLAHSFKGVFDVFFANDGHEGLKKATEVLPDIIISDVMMPKMNGMTMLAHIRKTPQLCTIPVILLTAKSTPKDTMDGLKTGADHYVVKPFDCDDLVVRMHRLIDAKSVLTDYVVDKKRQTKTLFEEKLDQLIIEHIADKDLNVEKLSALMFVDRSTLYRRIKKISGATPIAYIRQVRLDQAWQLLKNNKLSVSETAYACGFDSLSYFSKQFKKTYGSSPSDVL